MQIESKPSKVRGKGNVCNLKGVDDYVGNHSQVTLSEETEEVPYTVLVMENVNNAVNWFYTFPSEIKQFVTCNLTFGLKDGNTGEVISGASIEYYLNDVLVETKTTGSDGKITVTVPTTEFGALNIKMVYHGDSDYAPNQYVDNLIIKRKVIAHCNSTSWCSCRSADTNEPIEGVAFYKDGTFYGYTNSEGIFPGYPNISVHPYRCSFEKEDHYFEVIYDD